MKHNINLRRHKLRHVVLLLICMTAVCLLPACQFSQETGFPDLETSQTSNTGPSQTNGTTPTDSETGRSLTVALPLGSDCLESVRLLFLAKESGLINQEPGQYIGQQIAIEDLQQFDSDLTINLVAETPPTGATAEQIRLWQNSGSMPDIVYCETAADAGLENVMDLNDLLYGNQLLTAKNVFVPTLENCREGQTLYGIPYFATLPVIYFNSTLMGQLQLQQPANEWTWQDFLDFSGLSYQAMQTEEPSTKFVVDNPAELLNWLPASFDANAGYAMWDGQSFRFDLPAFSNAVDWLQEYADAGYSMLNLTAEERLAVLGTLDPIIGSKVLMWSGETSDLDDLQINGLQVGSNLMPTGLTLSVKPLVISKTCAQPQLAADFAAFIALDADSLLLQSRYQVFNGLIPLVNDALVWLTIVGGQNKATMLLPLLDQMSSIDCSDQQLIAGWRQAIKDSIGGFGSQLILEKSLKARNNLIVQMTTAASQVLQEE